jgi:hypothetical protein
MNCLGNNPFPLYKDIQRSKVSFRITKERWLLRFAATNDECGIAMKGVSERGNPEKASRD